MTYNVEYITTNGTTRFMTNVSQFEINNRSDMLQIVEQTPYIPHEANSYYISCALYLR